MLVETRTFHQHAIAARLLKPREFVMMTTPELKAFTRPNLLFPPTQIVYALLPGHCCVFTGVDPSGYGATTLEVAEQIVRFISARERLTLALWEFFDLRTHLMYGPTRPERLKPGRFEFHQITLVPGQRVETAWTAIECPSDVVELFIEHIGLNGVCCQRNRPDRGPSGQLMLDFLQPCSEI